MPILDDGLEAEAGAGPRQFTAEQVRGAANRAADDVIALASEDKADAINLVVNATLSYLEGTASTLTEVAEENYSDEPDEVLSWV